MADNSSWQTGRVACGAPRQWRSTFTADLVLTQRGADGNPVSWRLDENRKLRRDELHYLDSARLGLIVKVARAG